MLARQPDLLFGLAQCRCDLVGVLGLERPPGKAIWPACALRCAVRWVSSTDIPSARSMSGTSTAAGRSAVLGGVIPGLRSWSPRVACRNAAASAASAAPPKPRLPGLAELGKAGRDPVARQRSSFPALHQLRALPIAVPPPEAASLPIWTGIAQPEECPAAPHPELRLPFDLLLDGQARPARRRPAARAGPPARRAPEYRVPARPLAAVSTRSGLSGPAVTNSSRLVRKISCWSRPSPATVHRHGKKRNIFDRDAAALGRRDQPITAVRPRGAGRRQRA